MSILPVMRHPDAPAVYSFAIPITALAFGPDDRELFVAGYHEVSVWDAGTGALLRRVPQVGQRVYALVFDRGGRRLLVGSGTPGRMGEVRVLDVAAGDLVQVVAASADVVLDVAVSPAGDRLAESGADSKIRIFRVPDGDLELTIGAHSDWVHAITWNPEGTGLASASRDGTAKVLDAVTGRPKATYSGHAAAVLDIMFHPDGKNVLSSDARGHVHVWSVAEGEKVRDVGTFRDKVFCLTAGPDSFFASSGDGVLRQFLWDSEKPVRDYAGRGSALLSTAIDHGRKRVATGDFDGEVRVWNIRDGSLVTTFIAAPGLDHETHE
jgi:WD40 repeat protein